MRALILGGSSGIGKAVALRCARAGAEVIIGARDESRLAAVAEELRAAGAPSACGEPLDLAAPELLEARIGAILARHGPPSALLLNGGGPTVARLGELTATQWREGFDLVVHSAVTILRLLLPSLRPPASVLFILSDVVRNPGPAKILPCATRMALLGVMKCLSMEYAATGIRLNALSPGPTATERARRLLQQRADATGGDLATVQAKFEESLPVRRMAQPAEVAELAYFLLSEQAAYITGTNFMCDGGLSTVAF